MTAPLSLHTARTARSAVLAGLVFLALGAGACTAGRAFSKADRAAQSGDWDAAVEYYTRAAQAAPNRADYKVALQRALENAAIRHLEKGRIAQAKGQLDEALHEYKRAAEYDPLNGEIAQRVDNLNREITERAEAARPRPPIQQLREQARQTSSEPTLNPASRQPLDITFNPTPVRNILDFIAKSTGINITYDRDSLRQVDQQYSVELHGVTLEQALNQIMMANSLFYKVLDPHTVLVAMDTTQMRQKYEDQVIQTYYISHADATEVMNVLNQVVRVPGSANQPMMQVNKTANTITVRTTPSVAKIFERVIEANDKPRAELVLDVEVLEVNRTRAKQYGLDLNDYSASLVFSPGTIPGTTTSSTTGNTGSTGTGTTNQNPTAQAITHTNLFGLNSLRGFNKGDLYLSIPAALIRLLETDNDTRLVAKPQLRGSEGEKLSLNLGQQIPVPTTTFGAVGAGGINTIPVSSFQLKDVGLNFTITPRVTFENDIILTLTLENSTFQGTVTLAGQALPQFGQRHVETRLRLRDGETNLLAGLLQTSDSKSVTGFPGLVRVPVFRQIFSSNNNQYSQTDIVMLLTPHIIRSHDLTQRDVSPIYIGTPSNLGLNGPPPLIAAPPVDNNPPAGQANPMGGAFPPPAGAAGALPTQPGMATAGGQAGAVAPPAVQPPAGAPGQPPQPPAGQAAAAPPGVAGQPPAPATPVSPAAATPGTAATAGAGALVTLSVAGPDFRVGGGPYTVPIMITGASAITTMTMTIRYNPAVLRVRGVPEGAFMRQGGLGSGFTQQVDAAGGRIDITFNRAGDTIGASGGGLVASVLFDPVAPGSATLSISGVATGPAGAVPLQFAPATITVR